MFRECVSGSCGLWQEQLNQVISPGLNEFQVGNSTCTHLEKGKRRGVYGTPFSVAGALRARAGKQKRSMMGKKWHWGSQGFSEELVMAGRGPYPSTFICRQFFLTSSI